MELSIVTRTVVIPEASTGLWRSIATASGLEGWFADRVELDPDHRALDPGASGRAIDDGIERRFVVTEVEEGRALRFTWWDEAEPALVSTVEIDLHEVDGATTMIVTERLLGGAVASVVDASVAQLDDIEARWDRRLQALVAGPVLLLAAV